MIIPNQACPFKGGRSLARSALASFTGDLTLEQAQRIEQLCGSYERLPRLIELFHRMDHQSRLTVLGTAWSCCDNISVHLSWLRVMLPRVGPVRPMMTNAEQTAYDALPDKVTIYRGARHNHLGASWSLDRAVAAKFSTLHRYNVGGNPTLITAEVRKRDILAIKLDRDESEVIVLRDRKILSRETIDGGRPMTAPLSNSLSATGITLLTPLRTLSGIEPVVIAPPGSILWPSLKRLQCCEIYALPEGDCTPLMTPFAWLDFARRDATFWPTCISSAVPMTMIVMALTAPRPPNGPLACVRWAWGTPWADELGEQPAFIETVWRRDMPVRNAVAA